MSDGESELHTLLELEQRHDELLDRLADLDKRIETLLAQWQADSRTPAVATALK